MATGKRASMREGPLADLFRRTTEDNPAGDGRASAPQRRRRARPGAGDAPEPSLAGERVDPAAAERPTRAPPARPRSRAAAPTRRWSRTPARR